MCAVEVGIWGGGGGGLRAGLRACLLVWRPPGCWAVRLRAARAAACDVCVRVRAEGGARCAGAGGGQGAGRSWRRYGWSCQLPGAVKTLCL